MEEIILKEKFLRVGNRSFASKKFFIVIEIPRYIKIVFYFLKVNFVFL